MIHVGVAMVGGGDSLGLASDVSLRLEILHDGSVESTSFGIGSMGSPLLLLALFVVLLLIVVVKDFLSACLPLSRIPSDRARTSQSTELRLR